MAKDCVCYRRVKADECWTDEHISAALSLEEKSSFSAKREACSLSGGIIDTLEHRVVE